MLHYSLHGRHLEGGPHGARAWQQVSEDFSEFVIFEAVDYEVDGAIENNQEMGNGDRNIHEAPPISLTGVYKNICLCLVVS